MLLTALYFVAAFGKSLDFSVLFAITCSLVTFTYIISVSPSLQCFGMHWRMFLLYIINSLTTITVLGVLINPESTVALIISGSFILVVGITVLLSVVVMWIFPIPSACTLRGKHKSIGTTSFELPIERKERTYGTDLQVPDGPDRISIQCWFPLNDKLTPLPERFLRRIGLDYILEKALLWTSGHPKRQLLESTQLLDTAANAKHLNSHIMKHLCLARTNARWQASLDNIAPNDCLDSSTGGKYPVAIFSHGDHGWKTMHHTCAEQLASCGFIVLACDHTPDCLLSTYFSRPWVPFRHRCSYESDSQLEREFYMAGIERRVADLQCIIDFVFNLTQLQTQEQQVAADKDGVALSAQFAAVAGHIDAQSVHAWGHNYGGGSVAALCALDDRLASAAVLDSCMYVVPDTIRREGSAGAAVLNISSELWYQGKVSRRP